MAVKLPSLCLPHWGRLSGGTKYGEEKTMITLEERVKSLENKVAKLEGANLIKEESPYESKSKKEVTKV